MVKRIFVEKRREYAKDADKLRSELKDVLDIDCGAVRRILRYDIEGVDEPTMQKALGTIFSEPPVDIVYEDMSFLEGMDIVITEYLEGQYDQRADSAEQCVQFLSSGVRPKIACATVYAFEGLNKEQLARVKKHLINPIDSKEGSLELPETLKKKRAIKGQMRIVAEGFIGLEGPALKRYFTEFGFAMSFDDLLFVQNYFKKLNREPTYTELKVIDTYWSDHCRHTTFLTELTDIKIYSANPRIEQAFESYRKTFAELYAERKDKYICLMDIATITAKKLRKEGYLDNLDESEEVNACSVRVKVDNDGAEEEWLIQFKNETHNHPTEIEPYGGAATCLGGAIRDPLSGRAYVYQGMRITGAANPLEPYSATIEGKLPQRTLTTTALAGFSSYGNQVGLATGIVHELYHEGYKAKRLEAGYVIGGAPKANVVRRCPKVGDTVILVGGDTGRDGCGGATGSSKAHTVSSVDLCGAEVQKGNAPEERKLQRLFRNAKAARLIIRCNDFGAGGVSVAIGELAAGLDIFLERINVKYEGLTATELAISESQERMAAVVSKKDAERFIALAYEENLKAVAIADVTDSERLRMFYKDELIVDIERAFLDTNGVKQRQAVQVTDNGTSYFDTLDSATQELVARGDYASALKLELQKLVNCSQKGAGEAFDSTVGAATVVLPFGGKHQLTPAGFMASKPPVSGFTHTVTCSSYGIDPYLMSASPFIGAIYSIVVATSKLVAAGVDYSSIRLTLQEYFKKLNREPERWGEPLAALLGAYDAESNLYLPAIGGKDSMSGSFEELDVPPTLIAFAMGIAHDEKILTNAFKTQGYIYRFAVPKDSYSRPIYDKLRDMYSSIAALIESGKAINSAVCESSFLVTLAKCLAGNFAGAWLNGISAKDYMPANGDIILITKERIENDYAEYRGELNASSKLTANDFSIEVDALVEAFVSTLEPVFKSRIDTVGEAKNLSFNTNVVFKGERFAAPTVFMPIFPGTNCEFDTGKAFLKAGAKVESFVIKNIGAKDIEDTMNELKRRIGRAQILMFPGGFSAGDEPDGSGKFIATAFRSPNIAKSVDELLARGGLILGICNGFQALIKLGLLPYGKIAEQGKNSPTLTLNRIARHVSSFCRVRVASNNSPWLSSFKTGDIFTMPVSNGEGRFVASNEDIKILVKNGQIATQYADCSGNATMQYPWNPNGSMLAVEGILSPNGRIFGKMGHAERWQSGLYRNIEGNFNMDIFSNGVKYFR